MNISTEVLIAAVTAVVSAQSAAIAWLARQLIRCYVDRVEAQERALGLARRAVTAGRELVQ